MMKIKAKLNLIFIILLILISFSNFCSATIYVGENVSFTPPLSNVTYYSPPGGFTCDSIVIDNYCLNITGGTFANNYCLITSTPTNITLGIIEVNLIIYDEQFRNIINTTDTYLEFIGDTYSNNYTTSNGTLNINITYDSYEIRYNANGYHPRSYFVTLSPSINQTIHLYLLNDSVDISDRIIMTVYDQNGVIVPNATIIQQRNYVSNESSVFISVAMSKTNFEGQAVIYAELYDVWYKLIYLDADNNIIKVTDPSPFFNLNPTEQVIIGEDVYLSWREYNGVYNNVTFVNSSGTIYARYIYIDNSGLVRDGCLNVQRMAPDGLYDICYNCTTAASATISCIIDPSLPGEYKAVGLIETNTTNSWYPIVTDFYTVYNTIQYAQEGIFMGAVMIGTLALMGIGSVTGSLFFMILGLVGTLVMQIVVGFGMNAIYWLFILALIIIFVIRKRAI